MSLLLAICGNSSLDIKELTPTMLPFLLHQQSDSEVAVIEKAWLAMSAIIKVWCSYFLFVSKYEL